MKNCIICNKEFEPTSNSQKTCNNKSCFLKRRSLWEKNKKKIDLRYKNLSKLRRKEAKVRAIERNYLFVNEYKSVVKLKN